MPSGGHNKGMTKRNGKCLHEDCEKKIHSRGLCSTHYGVYRKHGWKAPIKRKERGTVDKTFKPERTCEMCGETKHWQRFVLGTDHLKNMCRVCHREKLSEQARGGSENKPNKNMEALLAFLNER